MENGDMDLCGCGRHGSRLCASVWQQPFIASVAYASTGKRRKSVRGQCQEQVRKRPSTNETGLFTNRWVFEKEKRKLHDALGREWKDMSSLDRDVWDGETMWGSMKAELIWDLGSSVHIRVHATLFS